MPDICLMVAYLIGSLSFKIVDFSWPFFLRNVAFKSNSRIKKCNDPTLPLFIKPNPEKPCYEKNNPIYPNTHSATCHVYAALVHMQGDGCL